MNTESSIPLEVIGDFDALYKYIDEREGKVAINVFLYTRPQLVNVAHQLNRWNANQPVSDALHNAHYKEYIQPIHDHLKDRHIKELGKQRS